jgi:hypothetical protein
MVYNILRRQIREHTWYVLKDMIAMILVHIFDGGNFLTMTQPSASLSDIGTASKIFCAQFIRFIKVTYDIIFKQPVTFIYTSYTKYTVFNAT